MKNPDMAIPPDIPQDELKGLRSDFNEDCKVVFNERLEHFSESLKELLWEMWLVSHRRTKQMWREQLAADIEDLLAESQIVKDLEQLKFDKLEQENKIFNMEQSLLKPEIIIRDGINNGALIAGDNLTIRSSGDSHIFAAQTNVQIDPDVGIQINFPAPDMYEDAMSRKEDPIQEALAKRIELLVKDNGDLLLWAHRDHSWAWDFRPTYTHTSSGNVIGIDFDTMNGIRGVQREVELKSTSSFSRWEFPNKPPENGSLRIFCDGEEIMPTHYSLETDYSGGNMYLISAVNFSSFMPLSEDTVVAMYSEPYVETLNV